MDVDGRQPSTRSKRAGWSTSTRSKRAGWSTSTEKRSVASTSTIDGRRLGRQQAALFITPYKVVPAKNHYKYENKSLEKKIKKFILVK